MVQVISEIWCKDCSNSANQTNYKNINVTNRNRAPKHLHITAVTDIPPSNSKNISFVNILSELQDVEYTRLGDLGKTLTYANSFLHIPPQDNPIYASPSTSSFPSLTTPPETYTPTPTTLNFRETSPPVSDIQLQVPTIQFNMDDSGRSKPRRLSDNSGDKNHDNNNELSESDDSEDSHESEDLSDDDDDDDNSDESEAQSMESLTTENAKLKLSKTLSSMSFISRTTTSASQAYNQGMNMSVYGTQEYPQPLKTSMTTGSLGGSFSSGYNKVEGFIDPADYYKSNEYTRNLELAEYNCIMNGGSDSLQQSKFSNLTEVEDLQKKKKEGSKNKTSKDENDQIKGEASKDKGQRTPAYQYRKHKSQISGLLGNKNIKDLTNEELALVEEQLGKSTKSKTGSNMNNYEFNMKQKLIFDDPILKNGSTASSFMKRMDMKKKKLLLQNGYPTRPWIRSKSIILTKQHPEYDDYVSASFPDISMEQKSKCFRKVFIYISNREHTWTSVECYFKYFARDGDHLIIGTRIPQEMLDPYSVIFKKHMKTASSTATLSANAKLTYYEDLEQTCEDACEDVLKYIYYKTFVYDKKIKFTINMSKSGDLKNCVETFLKEYDPHLILITSISFNLFIKFSNSHIKLSRLFTRFLRFCIVINQDFFNMEKPKTFKPIKDPLNVIDQCIVDSFTNPFDVKQDETGTLKPHSDILNQEFFQKYGYYKPAMISIDDCELDSFTDYSYYNFVKYLNKRRKNTKLIGYYDANLQVLKPASYYLNNFNKKAIAQRKPDYLASNTITTNISSATPLIQFTGTKRGSVGSTKSNATVGGGGVGGWNTLTPTKSGGSYHYRSNSTGSYGNTSDGANSLGGGGSNNNNIDGNIQKIKSLTGDSGAPIMPEINDKFTIVSNTQADMQHFKRQKKLLEQQKLLKLNSNKSESTLERVTSPSDVSVHHHHHHHHHNHKDEDNNHQQHHHQQHHNNNKTASNNERPILSLNNWSWKNATGSSSSSSSSGPTKKSEPKIQEKKNSEGVVQPKEAEKYKTNTSATTKETGNTSEESKPKSKKKDKKWKFW
ncbi:hypothetical protein ACO0QE_001705 [Hanseniaspora vineae]